MLIARAAAAAKQQQKKVGLAYFSTQKPSELEECLVMNRDLREKDPRIIIEAALNRFGEDVAISFSGAEDSVLIKYAKETGLPFRVFSLDTGRLHPETYQYFEAVEKYYGIRIEYTFPEAEAVKKLVRSKGMFSFYKDGHNECCGVRKVMPLRMQLTHLKAWITGQRKDQSPTRPNISTVEIDPVFKGMNNGDLWKFNPLADLSSKELWNKIISQRLPYNALHGKGIVSIGCEPCTRTTLPGEHERQGRWWWEETTMKECGLHAGNVRE